MTFGIFAGVMPVIPFQSILALSLTFIFHGNKVAALVGTWVSNPLTWTFLYYSSYKLGAWFLGLPGTNEIFASIMASIREGDGWMVIVGKMAASGSTMVATFLTGGVILGLMASIPSYLVFLKFFQVGKQWREQKNSRYRHG
jgi:uncharacterized protein (DUF2062 family)